MFKKKYTIKDSQSVGKSSIKLLKADVLEVMGKESGDFFDLTVGKKDAVTKSRCHCGTGTSAIVYSVNDVPFFISVERISGEDQAYFTESKSGRYSVVPTIFFFLRLRQLLADNNEQFVRMISEAAVIVTCFAPTSRFLLNGAHLMMPGIAKAHAKTPAVVGRVALVFSDGVNIPYAVGFVTGNFVSQKESGTGVYIVQCFRDNLWQEYENRFLANYSLSSSVLLIPSQFGETEVAGKDIMPTQAESTVEVQATNGDVSSDLNNGTASKNSNSESVSLFEDEDAVLTFSMCEAVKLLAHSMLPMPLPQFTSVVVQSFPRDGLHTTHIHFKDTKYKGALSFFQKFPELLTIAETSPGIHCVYSMNKSAPVMREHAVKYKTFLETTHRVGCEDEERALQAKLLESRTAVFRQNIVSARVFYCASHDINEDLVRVLLLGDELNIPENVRFPTLEQVMSGIVPKYEPTPIDESVFDEHYERKELVYNLRKYIRAHSLLNVNAENKGMLPTVKIDETLSKLLSSKAYEPELPITQVEDAMLSLFKVKHEIVVHTVVEGSSLASGNLAPKRIVKAGNLPKVNLWSEKVTNKKFVTIVRNLAAFGLDLSLLARQWKKQFSSSCSVVDPAVDMINLKNGTKIPLEIHLQGDLLSAVEAALLNQVQLPPSLLISGKK